MAEAEKRRGKKLQPAKPAVHFDRALLAHDPTGDRSEDHRENHADDRRKKNEQNWLDPAAEDKGFETRVSDGRSAVSADECVRRTCREPEDQSDEIPSDGAEEAGKDHLLIDEVKTNQAFADSAGHGSTKEKCRDEIPEGGPGYGAEGREDARGDDGGDGIGGVMPAVGEFERKCESDDDEKEMKTVHGLCAL